MRTILLMVWLSLAGMVGLKSQSQPPPNLPEELMGNVYHSTGEEAFNVNSIPSPEAASMGKYTHFPPANNNGTNSVNIPLGQVADGPLQVPIALNYHGSGIRVEDDPSMVGLGWTMSYGGVVTREVRGAPDDQVDRNKRHGQFGLSNYYSLGWLCNYSARKELPNFPYTYHRWTQFPEIPLLDLPTKYTYDPFYPFNKEAIVDFPAATAIYHENLQSLYNQMDLSGIDTTTTREVAAALALQNLFTARGDVPFPGLPNSVDYGDLSGLDVGYSSLTTAVTNDSTNSRYSNLDREADRFIINAPGLQGTFILDHTGKPQMVGSNSNYKIEYIIKSRLYPQNTSLEFSQTDVDNLHWREWHDNQLHIAEIQILNESGVTYIFDVVESAITIDSTYSFATSGTSVDNPQRIVHGEFNTAWFLSKMIAPDGKEINFHYLPNELNSTKQRAVNYGPCPNSSCQKYHFAESFTIQTTYTWIIDRIESDHQMVEFTPDPIPRKDLIGGARMESVTFYNKLGGNLSKIKRFQIGSEYIKGSGEYCGNIGGSNGDDDPYCWRLFLKSLCEEGYDDVAVAHKPAYEFKYWEETGGKTLLPHRRKSVQKDFWGYFNQNLGTNGGNFSLIPEIYIYPNQSGHRRYRVFQLPSWLNNGEVKLGLFHGSSDRTTNPSVVHAGMLEMVKYPSGGTTTYDYESNQFLDEGDLRFGAGVRIFEVTNCDGNGDYPCITKRYNYNIPGTNQTSGQLIRMPQHAYPTSFVKNPSGIPGLGVGSGLLLHGDEQNNGHSDEWFHALFTKRMAHSVMPLTDEAGAQISYTNVTIDELGIGETRHEYYPVRTYLTHSDIIEITPNWAHRQFLYIYDAHGGPVDDGVYEEDGLVVPYYGSTCAPGSSDIDFGDIDISGFNEIIPLPLVVDFDQPYGLQKSTEVVDQSGNTVLFEEFEYDTISRDHKWVHNLRFGDLMAFCNEQGPGVGFAIRTTQPHAWRKFQIHTGIEWMLTKTTSRTYDQGSSNNYVERINENAYEVSTANPTVFLRSTHIFQSDQGEIKTLFRYPFLDFFPSTGTGTHPDNFAIQALQDHNMNNIPIVEEIWQKKVGATDFSLLTAKFRRYEEQINGTVLPTEIHLLETLNPIPSVAYQNPDLLLQTGFLLDSRFKKEISSSFNEEGLTVEVRPENGTPQAYIYGMDEQVNIATVRNTDVGDIAYTSFEELLQTGPAYNGNWTITGAGGGWNNTLGKTGSTSFDLSSSRTLSFTPENPGTFVLTYWSLNQLSTNLPETLIEVSAPDTDGFKYYEIHVDIGTGQTLEITGANWGNYTDEVRLYPLGAQMTTIVLDEKLNMISSADERNTITYFDYDLMGRLHLVMDHYRSIVEAHDYNYREDPCYIDVDFSFTPNNPIINQSISFNAMTNFTVGSYSVVWDLGDGNSASGQSPLHSYPSAGVYRVKMTVTHSTFGVFEVEKDVLVTNPPLSAMFSTVSSIGGGSFQVSASGGIPPYTYHWEKIDLRNDPSGSVWTFAGSTNSSYITLECGGQVRCTIKDSAGGSFQQSVQLITSVGQSPNANPPCQF